MTMLLQTGPDSYVAHRRLSDGRHLAVFVNETMERRTTDGRKVLVRVESKPGKVVQIAVPSLDHHIEFHVTGYSVVISDNKDEPLAWRTVPKGIYKRKETAMNRFLNWEEGEDDRRKKKRRRSGRRRDVPATERRQGGRRASDKMSSV